MSKKNKKEKKQKPTMSREQIQAIRNEKRKIGKVHIFILFAMIVAALFFVIPRIQS